MSKNKHRGIINVLVGLVMLIIGVGIGLTIKNPDVINYIMTEKYGILKGVGIGLCILPLTIFIIVRYEEGWYKSILAWSLLLVGIGAILFIGLYDGNPSVGNTAIDFNSDIDGSFGGINSGVDNGNMSSGQVDAVIGN